MIYSGTKKRKEISVELKIESDYDAKSVAMALCAWLQQGLEASGRLHPRTDEPSHVTHQRIALNELEDWTELRFGPRIRR